MLSITIFFKCVVVSTETLPSACIFSVSCYYAVFRRFQESAILEKNARLFVLVDRQLKASVSFLRIAYWTPLRGVFKSNQLTE